MSNKTPPRRLWLRFCPVCGRDDRFQPFTGKTHYAGGKRCPGRVATIVYTPESDWPWKSS